MQDLDPARGVPVPLEELDLASGPCSLRELPGLLGPHRVAETIVVLADPVTTLETVEDEATVLMQLAGPGLLARRLGTSAHGSPLEGTWADLSRVFAR